jgi:hypothetical protein
MSPGEFDSDGLKDLFDIADAPDSAPAAPAPPAPVADVANRIAQMSADLQRSQEMIAQFQSGVSGGASLDQSLALITSELVSLLAKSNSLVDHCKYCIESQMLLDGEMVSAVSSLISSTQSIISSFMTIFRDRVKFSHACELEQIKFANKVAFSEQYLRLKAQYDPKLISAQDEAEVEKVAYRQEDLIKQIVQETLKSAAPCS